VIFSLALLGGGIWLFVAGATGNTEITLFNNQFKSQNVGLAAFFCGAVVFALNIRRTLKALERLGAQPIDRHILEGDRSRPIGDRTKPTWSIRELFFHIRPDLADDPEAKGWERVKKDVIDHFSTGALRVWGRPRVRFGKRGALKKVDEKRYWQHAEFTSWFLSEDGAENNHVIVKNETGLPDYSDLRVNKAEALSIWPISLTAEEDRIYIGLLDAARRTYSETRNDPAAAHAEAFGNTSEKILIWYCIWLAQHMQIFGARRPSTKIEMLALDDPPKDFEITNDTLTMRERLGSAIYENLRVRFDELPDKIKQLKEYGRSK
jgi:hypothetical protein